MLAKEGVLGPDIILVHLNELAVGNVEFFMLLWQNSHLFWVIDLHKSAICAHLRRNGILNLIQEEVVSFFKLTLLTVLVINLN